MANSINIVKDLSAENWSSVFKRPEIHENIQEAVISILSDVKENGDEALQRLTKRFDGVAINSVSKTVSQEIDISTALKDAILQASKNILSYHKQQVSSMVEMETIPGLACKQIVRPIEKVGLYIPGGTAPLLSSLMMLAVPAKIAGCQEIVICTPPNSEGNIHPAIEFIAKEMDVQQIYCVGGAQAIGAMAYGTETVPKVDKIFGPGNSFVTLAKELIQSEGIAIDMPAGPSELLVYADESAVPAFVASDLLSQAEHGNDSQVICIVRNDKLADEVAEQIDIQVAELPRKKIALNALKHSWIIVEPRIEKGMAIINSYAPEHLILACKQPETLLPNIQNAGSIFLGNWSAEAIGDYAAGPNHTLPTNGHAKAYSGINLDAFRKKISVQKVSESAFTQIADTVEVLAEAEQLIAHKRAISIRKEYLQNG